MLLNCHSYYSMCYGTLPTRQLLEEVQQKGYEHFALTDINNTSGWVEIIREIHNNFPRLKAQVGIDFRNGIIQHYIGIAKNNEGLRELNDHLSYHLKEKIPFPFQAPEFLHVHIIYPIENYVPTHLKPHEWIGVAAIHIHQIAIKYRNIPLNKVVILQRLTFRNKLDYNSHKLLRAVDYNILGSQLSTNHYAPETDHIKSKEEILHMFKDYPEIIKNTERILAECDIDFEFGKFANKNLTHYTGSVSGDIELLRQEAEKGALYRYNGEINDIVRARIDKELEVVGNMKFASYFLINWDIVKYAQRKDYFYVGRGSGANSLLAYLLRITDVDPIKLNLYFERFINPYRSTPPDFDVDFNWTDREDITDYIFKRFDKHGNVALLGSYTTFQLDAGIRELGKVFGLPPAEIDKLQTIRDYRNAPDQISKQILRYAQQIKGFPSHNSIHASGILISEKPIHSYSATFIPPKGYPTTHFSMLEAEDIGLYKFDILSQRGLGKIKDCIELVQQKYNIEIDIHNIEPFTKDPIVMDILKHGRTIGCFYVESPAMRMLLCKLKADDYLRLVAASSIIRPGVSKSGMMREYILRYRNPELREAARKALPQLYDLLEETYGVMVYQEDVIKIAHLFAGLTLAESDYLRRGMSWKFRERSEFNVVKDRFFENCKEKGYSETIISDIWKQIESFANYAFSKGHSASYAVESYQALYLKAHYPIEYMTATINNGGGFYRPEVYLHEARMHGATIMNPCINKAEYHATTEDKTIIIGFSMVKELQAATIKEFMTERKLNGPFTDLSNFVQRINISLEQTRLLISIGAFDFTGRSKMQLLWDIHTLLSPRNTNQNHKAELFPLKAQKFKMPELVTNKAEDAFKEMEILGFTKTLPFDLLRNEPPPGLLAKDLAPLLGKEVSVNGYLVHAKFAPTSNKSTMCFGTFLDVEGAWIDTVHFPPSLSRYKFAGKGIYHITGVVAEEYDFVYVNVKTLNRLAYIDREM